MNKIPVLFHDYTHNLKKINADAFDYSPSRLMCYTFEELLERTKTLLFSDSSALESQINKLSETIYYVDKKTNVKNRIIEDLENRIINN